MDDEHAKILLTPLNVKDYKLETVEAADKRFYEKVVRAIIDFK